MALALILRNASRIQAGALQQYALKSSSIIMTRDFSSSLCQNRVSANKNLAIIPYNQILVSPQVRLMSGDHSKLWPLEKALSVALLVVVPAAIAMPNVVLDNILAIATVMHFHWGLEAVVVDYARPIVVGNLLPKLAMGLLYLVSAVTLGGLIYFNINDIGIGKTIQKLWAIKKN